MKKQKTTTQDNIWDTPNTQEDTTSVEPIVTKVETKPTPVTKPTQQMQYDLEGLMTDFPTAKELERFVFDETQIVLNLKGRANKLKYQIAMDVLNGEEVDPVFFGDNNPYIDKAEMIPMEELKPVPARSTALPPRSTQQNAFFSPRVPHPDEEQRAQDKKVDMVFRKYNNGMISYEILGPLETKPFGEKIDKFGRTRPEIIKWIDPRTGEQIIMREDGTLTPQGQRLRAMMLSQRVNNSNAWDIWIDREFVSLHNDAAHNPWDLK